jgi:acid phosphatase
MGWADGQGDQAPLTQAQTEHLPNAPFAIDDPNGFNQPVSVTTRDLWHRFYENQMQMDGGKNDKFAAFADSGALVMGHYGSKLPLWSIAQHYTLADNFFQGHFGGSFSNHFELVCACMPYYANADISPAKGMISVVEQDGVTLKPAPNGPKSALDGPPKFANSNNLSPDFYAINTMQPPYQPSAVKPAENGDQRFADPEKPTTLPPQHEITIGDLLTLKGVSWAWYAGAWQAVLEGKGGAPAPNFQFHHQPFNYFANYAPGTKEREEHIRDGGTNGVAFINAIDGGKLPQVTFYKPQGNLNEHAGYADVMDGDRYIADIVAHLERSAQWTNMLVVVTL